MARKVNSYSQYNCVRFVVMSIHIYKSESIL